MFTEERCRDVLGGYRRRGRPAEEERKTYRRPRKSGARDSYATAPPCCHGASGKLWINASVRYIFSPRLPLLMSLPQSRGMAWPSSSTRPLAQPWVTDGRSEEVRIAQGPSKTTYVGARGLGAHPRFRAAPVPAFPGGAREGRPGTLSPPLHLPAAPEVRETRLASHRNDTGGARAAEEGDPGGNPPERCPLRGSQARLPGRAPGPGSGPGHPARGQVPGRVPRGPPGRGKSQGGSAGARSSSNSGSVFPPPPAVRRAPPVEDSAPGVPCRDAPPPPARRPPLGAPSVDPPGRPRPLPHTLPPSPHLCRSRAS